MAIKTLAIAALATTLATGTAQAQMFGPQPQPYIFHYQPIAPAPQPFFQSVPAGHSVDPFAYLRASPTPPPPPQMMLIQPNPSGTGGYFR